MLVFSAAATQSNSTKINYIFKKLQKLKPNKEFDTSAAQLVNMWVSISGSNYEHHS